MQRLLIVDDDVELCELVAEYLGPEGFEVAAVHDGARGVERAVSGDVDIVILDVMLPGMNGLDTLRAIRARSSVPVLMLTARGADVDRIVGLEIGADDYLAKPFNPRELLARVRAILRRATPAEPPESARRDAISVADVSLDRGARVVFRGGEPVELTSVEFDLLDALLRAAGTVVSRNDLALAALGREISPLDRAVDQHVSNLRRKLGAHDGGFDRIKSVRGSGYMYTLPPAPEP
jgi:two-component system response regulator CpxR